MPSHRLNDSTIEPIVGPQMSARSSAMGMPSRTQKTATSRLVNRRRRRRRPGGAGAAAVWRSGVAVAAEMCATVVALLCGEDVLLLRFDALAEAVDVLRVLDELLDGLNHHCGREVRPGVAVHELRDLLGAADQL